jgi:uncharacterized LabA/DUF88 family protein
MIFWDVSNFFITLRGLAGQSVRFDFVKFAKALQGNDDLIKIYFACSREREDDRLSGFFSFIDNAPYFYVKEFERSSGGGEKQVDVYLAAQMVALAYEKAYDIAYIVSGDQDFVPAIEIVHQKGKIAVAVSAGSAISSVLKRKADRCIMIDDDESEGHRAYFYRNFMLKPQK